MSIKNTLVLISIWLLLSWIVAIRRLGVTEDSGNNDNSFDISIDGDVSNIEVPVPSSETFPVTFVNGYANDSLLLYWLDGLGDTVFMGEIDAGSQLTLNSYEQHAFSAKPKSGLGKVTPRVV